MPIAALKLLGPVNENETAVLNENSGISSSNLIRFLYDSNGLSLVQKLGGWSAFVSYPMPAVVRALWAWEDLNLNAWLAVGTETIGASGSALLGAITGGVLANITPTALEDDVAPVAQSNNGDASITITDTTTTGITQYNSVYIATQISIGGVVLFGLYACDPDGFLGTDAYTVYAIDQLGNLLPATSTSSSPSLPVFSTTLGELSTTVTLPNYVYQVGDTFPVLVPTTVGGITFYGNYVVQTTPSTSTFTILANAVATATATGTLNGGNARYIYSFGQGVIPSGTGYGSGYYGQGGYGSGTTVQPATGDPIDAVDWTLDNFGEILVACPDRASPADGTPFQPIYVWTPGSGQATVLTNAPPVNDGVFVAMPERQIVAWGSTETGIQDPLLISWCDVNNPNQWIPLPTNQAGQFRIPTGSRIVAAVQGPQQGVVWTDVDCYAMQYIGLPDIWGFTQIGKGCGLIARKAAAFVSGIGYWMGPSQFFTLSAYGVQILPCSVWDVVFQNMNSGSDSNGIPYVNRIRVAVNSRFGEIEWFYPSAGGSGEVDSYVKYNVLLNLWDYGALGRSAWVDQSVLGPPVGSDPSSLMLYQHETSNDAAGEAMQSYFQTGYFALNEGNDKTFMDWVWPDMKWGTWDSTISATVQITFYVMDYPNSTPIMFGPYSVSQATTFFYTRLRGRLISIKISSTDLGTFWRIGLIRYRFAPDGRI